MTGAGFAGSADLAMGGVRVGVFFLTVGGRAVVFAHGFGGEAVALGVGGGGGAVEEVGHFWAVPGVRLVMVLVKFDFEVDLHINNNCIISSIRGIIIIPYNREV